MIGLIMATLLEAEPFVSGLALQPLAEKPFAVFGREGLRLIICGIGKINAATGTTHLILSYAPGLICNPGAAGATDTRYSLGEGLHIEKIFEPDRPDFITGLPREHQPDVLPGFPLAVLATQDRPIHTPEERAALAVQHGLVDMEGASIARVCQRYSLPCYLFKYVSDLPDHTTSQSIRDNIESCREPFFAWFSAQVLPRLERAAASIGGLTKTTINK